MTQKPQSAVHFPDLHNLFQSPAHALAVANANLEMAVEANQLAMPALNEHQISRAYGLSQYAATCLAEAHSSAHYLQDLLRDHASQHADCIPDDCRAHIQLQQASRIIETAQDLADENQLVYAEVAARNKNLPILEDEIEEASAKVQMDIRLNRAREISALLEDRHNNPMNAQERQALVLTLEYLAFRPSGRPHEFCNHPLDDHTAAEDFAHKQLQQKAADRAQTKAIDLYTPHAERANEAMVLELSSSMKDISKARKWLDLSHQWLAIPEPGIYISRQAKAKLRGFEEALEETHAPPSHHQLTENITLNPENNERMEAFISFVHNGKRMLKAVQDPYPKGVSQDTALYHLQLIQDAIHDAWHRDILPTSASYILQHLAYDAVHLANSNVHDIPIAELDSIASAAKDNGATPGTVAMIMSVVTSDSAWAIAPPKGQNHRWWQLEATSEQAKATIQAARKIGLDHNALTSIARALGYRPEELDIEPDTMPDSAIQKIISQADQAGIPKELLHQLEYMLRN